MYRSATCVGNAAMLGALVLVLSGGSPAFGQDNAASSPSRPFGARDLTGAWDFSTITPLERPVELGDTAVLTAEQVAQLEREASEDPGLDRPESPGSVGGYNQFWADPGSRVVAGNQSSVIVDPANGRLPAFQPGVKLSVGPDRVTDDTIAVESPVLLRSTGLEIPAGPEDRGLAERCLLGFNTGPPMLSSLYNNHIQIFQNDDFVVIINEMVHELRIVPLDDRPRLPAHIYQWMGSSRGRWEGDVLVVDTTHFSPKTASFNVGASQGVGTGDTLHLIERFARLDDNTLSYEFTVDDPTIFTAPFTGLMSMTKMDEPMFEYACHEGNYGLQNILRGARRAEARAEESQQ